MRARPSAPRSRSARSWPCSAPASARAPNLDTSSVSLSTLKDKLDPSLDDLRRRHPQPVVPGERTSSGCRSSRSGRHPAGEGLAHRHGAPGLPEAHLRRGPRLRHPLHRLRHADTVAKMTRARPGQVPPDLVQAEQRHPGRGRRHDPGRDQAQAREALQGLGRRQGPREEHRRPSPLARSPWSTSWTSRARPSRWSSAATSRPPTANPDEIAIETMNIILGGDFISRINMNLREDKHWSYGRPERHRRRPRPAAVPRLRARAVGQDQGDHGRDQGWSFEGILGKKPITQDEFTTPRAA